MTVQAHPLRRLFSRFFPRKAPPPPLNSPIQEEILLPPEERVERSFHYLSQGELALLQGNLNALSHFEAASSLNPGDPAIWYRQGLAFFEYGSEEGKEKALLIASKNFKIAVQLDPTHFDAWVAWGNTLLQLGKFHAEHHFHLEARDKYEKALSLADAQPKGVLAELYWDYGIVWSEIAAHSGEAIDVRLAIDSFQKSLELQESPSPEFWNDCGKAYLELGLLVNDARLYLQSIDYLQKATTLAPLYIDGWISLGECFSQLYLNTMDERYVTKASDAFAGASRLAPENSDVWLSWGQLLGEAGRLNKDPKMLRLGIEKCARASALDPENSLIVSQWVDSLSALGEITHRLDLLIEAENKVLKATDQFPDDPDLWLAYGVCLIGFGTYYEDPEYYDLAIEKLQYGLSLDRTSAELWHALGQAHKLSAELTQDKDLIERANRFFARALDLKPSCPALLFDAATALLYFSELMDDLHSLEEAIYFLETLLKSHKEAILHHPEWLFEYACALEWLASFTDDSNHYLRAIELFSHLLLINPDFPRIHHRIALCYTHLGHISGEAEIYRKAIHAYRLAARQDEESETVWLDWGLCLIHLAHHTLDPDLAQQLFFDAEEKIVRSGRLGHGGAYYHLACLYSLLGRLDESMELIRKALAARALPPLEELMEDEWLESLRVTPAFAQFLSDLEAKLQQLREE